VVQAKRARLRAQHAARAHPVEQPRARHFRKQLVAQHSQLGDLNVRGNARVVGERHVHPPRGQLGCERRDLTRGRVHDQADVRLRRGDVDQFVDVQQLVRNGGDLVGRHHPRAQSQQQRQLHRDRYHPQAPAWDRPDPAGRLQHHVHGRRRAGFGGVLRLRALRVSVQCARLLRGEARLHLLAQLVRVVGQAQQVERRHRSRVQARVTDGQTV